MPSKFIHSPIYSVNIHLLTLSGTGKIKAKKKNHDPSRSLVEKSGKGNPIKMVWEVREWHGHIYTTKCKIGS